MLRKNPRQPYLWAVDKASGAGKTASFVLLVGLHTSEALHVAGVPQLAQPVASPPQEPACAACARAHGPLPELRVSCR